ncbi:hypothetical protein UlMin_022561 [Ulmus minor]
MATLPWFFIFFYLLKTTSSNHLSLSYDDHCSSFVPSSTKTSKYYFPSQLSSLTHTGYCSGGGIDPSYYAEFRTWNAHETEEKGLISVEGSLMLIEPTTVSDLLRKQTVRFKLHGFWSESSGRLCLVGYPYSIQGQSSYGPVSLKLNNLKNSTELNSLIIGTLESLSRTENDQNYLKPISIVLFPKLNYEYTLVSEEFDDSFSLESDLRPSLPLSSLPQFCSLLPVRKFNLKYGSHCISSAKNCTPFGAFIDYLPEHMLFNRLSCSEGDKRMRFLIKFQTSDDQLLLFPNSTLVGEGIWDSKKNELHVVACRLLNMTNSWENAHVGDCSTRLSLRFPAIWTIGNTSGIVGHIWSNKTVNASGYFDTIRFENSQRNQILMGSPDLKYEYTKMDRVKKFCPKRKLAKNKGNTYPNAFSRDMRFDLYVKTSERKLAWGYVEPLSVGTRFYKRRWYRENYHYSNSTFVSTPPPYNFNAGPVNISYLISIGPQFGESLDGILASLQRASTGTNIGSLEINAEGIYDETTGSLCMTGCRKTNFASEFVDCEILVNFQLPPQNSKENAHYIKGNIESTRGKEDVLYFKGLEMSSAAFDTTEAEESITKADVEIIVILVSNTLACVFSGLQLFHLRKHPDVLPFVSLTMLFALTLGYTIPLLLHLEGWFAKAISSHPNVLLGSGGWLQAKGLTEGVTQMILFLLQLRLLQHTWLARASDGNRNELWMVEKEVLLVASPLYVGAAFLTVFSIWTKKKHDVVMFYSALLSSFQEHPVSDALKSYGNLLVDSFLIPQILLNMFRDSRENGLSRSFYIGTTFVRLLPHVYGLYKAQTFNFFSVAWDAIVPFAGLLFATIIYFQQRFGGRWILPLKIRELEINKKVPTVEGD